MTLNAVHYSSFIQFENPHLMFISCVGTDCVIDNNDEYHLCVLSHLNFPKQELRANTCKDDFW